MRKLHLISAMFTSQGHGREYISNFCAELADHYDIILHVAAKPSIDVPQNIQVVYTGIDYKRTEAQNFIHYSVFAPYFRAMTKQFLSFKFYRELLKSEEIRKDDLVYIMDYDVFPLSILINGLIKKGTKIFIWVHSGRFESKNILYSTYKSIFKVQFQKFVSKVEGIIVNGDYIKDAVLSYLKVSEEKVHVIQYPSSIPFKIINKKKAREELGLGQQDNIILSFGMLRKDKNIEFLIRSVSNIKSDAVLLIVGAESSVTKRDIEFWIEKYELKNYRLHIDYIDEELMAYYYSASDLLILTYNIESGSQSGPLSLAREFELPAIVSNTGEIKRYVQINEVGLVADLKKDGDFGEKIDSFFLSPILRTQIKLNTKTAKELYSWDSAKNKYLKIFNA